MTLIEMAVAMPIILIALVMFAQLLTAGVNLREVGSDEWSSSSAAQDVLEQIRNENFADLFRLYNEDPFDDPDGPGTAPSNRFVVANLQPLPGAPDGTIGEIILPTLNIGTEVSPEWQVREDQVNADLGTPRDLNGDAVIDDLDHSTDYSIIPIFVRLSWQGRHGPREFELFTVLSEFR
jgi:type II secretory pathway pseudopilin PulG